MMIWSCLESSLRQGRSGFALSLERTGWPRLRQCGLGTAKRARPCRRTGC
nr:MAG TPA: hypothetical protein [Caudoviricetes sp.]